MPIILTPDELRMALNWDSRQSDPETTESLLRKLRNTEYFREWVDYSYSAEQPLTRLAPDVKKILEAVEKGNIRIQPEPDPPQEDNSSA